ncbi:chorismate mutase [Kosakonia radicincitans DSM 16656]|uniref:chorismate mutase n=1 Tax=Kosakonia radicincitans TaxID=283686 RepID=UPI0005608C04|nr:chorismate mutase [Kosakonia radicincitans]ARD63680.1 chorismate mutase [Kosakonia radicincitans DSM 16656]
MPYKLYTAVLLLAAATFSATAASAPSIGNLINERLSWMKDVAGYKAQHHQAIEDLQQEEKVLESTLADADSLGLKGESVRPFIQAQMDAAKAIQYRYRADWLAAPETDWQPRPLQDVRTQIGQLSARILQSVAARLKSGQPLTEQDRKAFMHVLQQKNLHEQDKQRIWETMKRISLKD